MPEKHFHTSYTNINSRIPIVFFLLLFSSNIFSQTNLYSLNTIQKIEIYFSQPNWDYQMDTAKSGSENYIVSSFIKLNGVQFDSVGIKYKGNSSYDSTFKKNPIHIELNAFKTQYYQGISDIKLSNCYDDPSMIREVLAYAILNKYMECPRSNFAQLYINDEYIGLYSNDEAINKQFCANYFNSTDNTFIKCNPKLNPGPASKCNIKYISTDTFSYTNFYQMKSNEGWKDLVKLCDTVSNFPSRIENVIDLDKLIWMLAFNNLLVNLDSYTGAFCQNYYLYKDNNNLYNPIVWDLNMSFGGFPFAGSPNNGFGGLNLIGMQQLPSTLHATHADWPLINSVMINPMYKRMYFAHMRTLINENFANSFYQTLASQLQSKIDTAVKSDSNKFYSYSQFQNGLSGNVAIGSYTIPGIVNLMSARITYLQSTTELSQSPPTISLITTSTNTPKLNEEITITAQVFNTNNVSLNYKFNKSEKFNKIIMYDDGTHNDGSANDNVYGNKIKMLSEELSYYLYAENANAGIFSPQSAEHVFYTLNVIRNKPLKNEIVINEFLTSNNKSDINEYGIYTDWIELYNNSDKKISLFEMYLSDDLNNRKKFSFPAGSYIEPKNYFAIWADELYSKKYVHCNFKLSNINGYLSLSNDSGILFDEVSYNLQQTDISTGRCPDGYGSYVAIKTPTFLGANNSNCTIGIDEKSTFNQFKIYPNPASEKLFIYSKNTNAYQIEIHNSLGQILLKGTFDNDKTQFDLSKIESGIYFIRFLNSNNELLLTEKLIVAK